MSSYQAALQVIDEVMRKHNLGVNRPKLLHHYTSVGSAISIIDQGDLRLCHSQYLNDESEVTGAVELVRSRLDLMKGNSRLLARQAGFYSDVESGFNKNIGSYEVFVFCTSEGSPGKRIEQDILSAWRAYGQNGRGVCLSFDMQDFMSPTHNSTSPVRLSDVIYNIRYTNQHCGRHNRCRFQII